MQNYRLFLTVYNLFLIFQNNIIIIPQPRLLSNIKIIVCNNSTQFFIISNFLSNIDRFPCSIELISRNINNNLIICNKPCMIGHFSFIVSIPLSCVNPVFFPQIKAKQVTCVIATSIWKSMHPISEIKFSVCFYCYNCFSKMRCNLVKFIFSHNTPPINVFYCYVEVLGSSIKARSIKSNIAS